MFIVNVQLHVHLHLTQNELLVGVLFFIYLDFITFTLEEEK